MSSPMPHPDDQSVAIRPHKRQEGIYVLVREPWDTEMHITEPNTDSYLMTWEDGKLFMKTVMEAPEAFIEGVSDALYNFYNLAVDFDEERFICLRQEKDGWEKEISLGFHDARQTEGIPDGAY